MRLVLVVASWLLRARRINGQVQARAYDDDLTADVGAWVALVRFRSCLDIYGTAFGLFCKGDDLGSCTDSF